MRTKIELKARHHRALLTLATRRGQKGISSVLAEVIEAYLDGKQSPKPRPLSLEGSIPTRDARSSRRFKIL